ncbi:MAG: hypothetical protein ABI862_08990, partial [Ilumatobacteraceae bacterium]
MDTSDDGIMFDPPRPVVAPPTGPPLLPPPSTVGQAPLSPPQLQPQPFVPQADAATATIVSSSTGGKRSRGRVVGGLIAVIALIGAGGFAISKIAAGDDGGAANPTEVGTRLVDALGAEDALGVVDLLLPGERDMLRQPMIDLVDNLKRLEIAGSTANLDKVGGLDLAFEDVRVVSTETNVDDISDIRITATATSSADGANVPIGDLLIDEAFGGHRPVLDSESRASDIDWKLATVKRDGRWYLSAFYSIAENVRENGHDIPATPIIARGADTPEGAVQAILDAVADRDLEGLIATLNPNEAEALQRYAPMFIDQAQSGLDDLDAKIAFSNTKYTVTGNGDRRTVAVDALTMEAGTDDGSVSVEVANGCLVVKTGDSTMDSCQIAGSIDDALGVLGLDGNEDLKSLITTSKDAFSDLGPLGITVQRVGGRWFVSPIGTFMDLLLAELKALDKNELTDIIDGVKKVSESLSTTDILGIGQDSTTTGDESDDGDLSGFDACYDETDYSAYSACVVAGIEDGSIDPTFVAPYYRFAECGVGEQYWNGDVYGMSDEAFTAFATAAAPCFRKHVSEGTISEFELPYELSRPDCL